MAWAKNGTPATLTVAGDTITISDLTAKKFNFLLHYEIGSGTIFPQLQLNNDSALNYANRRNANGGSDALLPNRNGIFEGGAASATSNLSVTYLLSISGEEKLGIRHTTFQTAAGAGTAPGREEIVGKYVPSPDADITVVEEFNTSGGDYDIDSNLSALGTD